MGLVPFRQPSTLFCCCHLVLHIFCCIVENKPSFFFLSLLYYSAEGRKDFGFPLDRPIQSYRHPTSISITLIYVHIFSIQGTHYHKVLINSPMILKHRSTFPHRLKYRSGDNDVIPEYYLCSVLTSPCCRYNA